MSGRGGRQSPVGAPDLRPRNLAARDRQLVPKREQLHVFHVRGRAGSIGAPFTGYVSSAFSAPRWHRNRTPMRAMLVSDVRVATRQTCLHAPAEESTV
jgi:hypothetical protein